MKPAVAKWLEFAEIDLQAAKVLLKEGGLTPVVCFHSHQSVEKSLKALVESKALNPRKSHDLIMLYGQVEDMVRADEDTLAKLNQIYIDTRYPASLGSLPEGLPAVEDAEEFYEFARDIFNQVKAVLQAA